MLMTVYLAYAEDAKCQHYLTLQVNDETSLYEALRQAGWLVKFPALARWCEQVADIATQRRSVGMWVSMHKNSRSAIACSLLIVLKYIAA